MRAIELPPSSPLRAAIWMLGALGSFSLMAIAGRELSDDVSTFVLMFYRSLIGLTIALTIAAFRPGGFRALRTGRPRLHLLRNLFHFTGQNLWFFAIGVIPLAQVFALEFTAPIWVAMLAPFFLGERMTTTRFATALIGFAGVLVILHPGAAPFEAGQIAVLAAALCFAVTSISTKKLSQTETSLQIVFWMTLMQTALGLIFSFTTLAIPDPVTALWLGVVGVCGLTAHFCLAQALRWADAGIVAPLDFFRLPLIAVVAMLIYGEPLEVAILFGGLLIFGANFANMRAERRRSG